MITTLEHLVDRAQEEYLTAADLDVLTAYNRGFNDRSRLYEKLGKLEDKLVRSIVDETGGPAENDLRLMLRYTAMAMLLDDTRFLEERYLDWLGDQARATGRLELLLQIQKQLSSALAGKLWPGEAKLIQPFVNLVGKALI